MPRRELLKAPYGEATADVRQSERWHAHQELSLTRVFEAPLRLVWDAWTSPEHLRLWLRGPLGWAMSACEVDLREGGAWRLSWSGGDGEELWIRGVYREVRAPEWLVSTSSWGDGWPDARESLLLAEEAGSVRVTQATRYASEEALDAAVGRGAKEAMVEAFADLEAYLASYLDGGSRVLRLSESGGRTDDVHRERIARQA